MSKKQRTGKGKQSVKPSAAKSVPPATPAQTSVSAVAPAELEASARASVPPVSAAPDTVPATPKKKGKARKATLAKKLDRIEQKLDEKAEAAAAARAGFASDPGADDTTVPPVVEDEFFSVGDAPYRPTAGMSGAFEALPDARMQHKMSPAVHARRARFSRWVQWAVGAGIAILAVGFVAKAMRPKEDASVPPRTEPAAVAAAPAEPAAAAEPASVTQPEPPSAEEPKSEGTRSDEPAAAEPKKDEPPVAAAEPKKDEPVAAVEPKKDEPPVAAAEAKKDEPVAADKPARTAAQEKAAAQAALDRNAVGPAIAAAKRSVELDPSDAEAWLILGAGYQMQGNTGAARAAFSSCVKQATKGPKGECQQMLQ
jgi:outer membrane biosynthesis protein TonB